MTVRPSIEAPPRAVVLVDGKRVWWTAVRKRSLVWFAIMAPISAASGWWLTRMPVVSRFKWLLAAPCAIAYVGSMIAVAGFVLGHPLRELDDAWNKMAGWRRGVLGLVLCVIATLLLVGLGGVLVTFAG
ncbi:MAG TPA: hypothetical protein VGO00_09975 [Kofleriaceae bacterium]|jgi:hypothetical protein|nr:hypothetical protein [Kofleriaceae bacterium]